MDGSPEFTQMEPDERGRISLARLPGRNAARYAGRRLDDGTIVLKPVVVLPVRALDSLRVALTSHNARMRGRSGTTPLSEVLGDRRAPNR
jgi:hypothetical protein